MASKVTVTKELALLNALSPIEVTLAGMVAVPAQLVCPVITLPVIVNEPVTEPSVMQSTTTGSAHAGGPTKFVVTRAKSKAMLRLRRVFIFVHSCGESL